MEHTLEGSSESFKQCTTQDSLRVTVPFPPQDNLSQLLECEICRLNLLLNYAILHFKCIEV